MNQAGGDEGAVFNFAANQGGPDQRIPPNARWTLEERRNHFQNKHSRYYTTATANAEPAGDGTLCITNKRTKRVEENSVMIEPADPSRNKIEKWVGTFTGTQGPVSMAEHFAATHAPNTKTLALIVTRPVDESYSQQPRKPKLNLLPDIRTTKRNADEGNLCANCHKNTHVLADCVWPYRAPFGDIFGCPICNTKDHRFDDCHNQARLTDWNRFEFLILRRAGKCMIRSEWKVYQMILQYIQEGIVNPAELVMPWTRDGARHLVNDQAIATFQNLDYSNPQRVVTIDPNCTPERLQALSDATNGGDFSTYAAQQREQRNANRRLPQPPVPEHHPVPQQPILQQPAPQQLVLRPDAQRPQPQNPQPRSVHAVRDEYTIDITIHGSGNGGQPYRPLSPGRAWSYA
ncbi:uncharacterized protein F4812DRAFT_458583 [Daldinia caldariorum]|uniref:uncharacterized protein n=1 Tax=Daldinia caldariorum TaxID=326644 RepID=UPI0020075204|nr:uncharacterized protein F4812DRAFT_458583 [Daldinia caldariorum]KAI1469058.1 hypothetical protein F4812DRAFT_458583 [Daldinia caldariorum]